MANLRKIQKMGATSERTAGNAISGKPVSKAAKSVSKKVDKAITNKGVAVGGKKSVKKMFAATDGIVKQYSKETKKK